MTPTTRPIIRRTVSGSVSGGTHPGTATAIRGTSMTGIPFTAGSIPMRSGSPTTPPDTTVTGEGSHPMEGDTRRGDTAWRVRHADHGAAIVRRQGVTWFRPCRPDAQERQGEPFRTEGRLHAGQLSTAHRRREDMQGQECHRAASRGCGDLHRALLLREAARGGPAGGAIPLRRAIRHLPVAAAGVAAAVEAEVRGAEGGAVAEAEAREVAAEGVRQKPGR